MRVIGAGVDVFCIAPGAIDTPMFQASSLNHLSDSQLTDFISKMGQARLIPPKEIAEQIFFLCRCAVSFSMLSTSLLPALSELAANLHFPL